MSFYLRSSSELLSAPKAQQSKKKNRTSKNFPYVLSIYIPSINANLVIKIIFQPFFFLLMLSFYTYAFHAKREMNTFMLCTEKSFFFYIHLLFLIYFPSFFRHIFFSYTMFPLFIFLSFKLQAWNQLYIFEGSFGCFPKFCRILSDLVIDLWGAWQL